MRLYSTKQTRLHSFYNEVERLTHDIIVALKLKIKKEGGSVWGYIASLKKWRNTTIMFDIVKHTIQQTMMQNICI